MDQLHAGLNLTPSTCSSYSVTRHPGHTYWLASDLGLKRKSLLQEFRLYRPSGHWPQIFKNNICFRRICAHAWVDVFEGMWAGHVCMFGIYIQLKELLEEMMHVVSGQVYCTGSKGILGLWFRFIWCLSATSAIITVLIVRERWTADDDHVGCPSVISGDPLRDSCLKHLSLFQR